MILNCPACGAALIFDPETGKMKCESCNNLYESYQLQEDIKRQADRELKHSPDTDSTSTQLSDASDSNKRQQKPVSFNPESSFDNPIYDHASDHNEQLDNPDISDDETMECSIYTCTACGAEIMVNDIEVSTFCSYCGQPTLIFSRVVNAKKPRYIIPFSVTKERAAALIKETFANGELVPDDVKNIKMDRVRGIYIPYWLYDIHYEDRQLLQGTVGSGKNSQTFFYSRKAECNFEHLAMEASQRLNDVVSRKLNPYHAAYMKDFSVEYLSGFYSDMFDVDLDRLKGQAILRAQSTFDNEMKRSVAASKVQILKKKPSFEITHTDYALYPAWFFTFRSEGRPYTLLVNGQTEKVVGSVPYDKGKAVKSFLLLGVFFSVIVWCVLYPYFLMMKPAYVTPLFSGLIMAIVPLKYGIETLKSVKSSTHLTTLASTEQYVKDRQGGN